MQYKNNTNRKQLLSLARFASTHSVRAVRHWRSCAATWLLTPFNSAVESIEDFVLYKKLSMSISIILNGHYYQSLE